MQCAVCSWVTPYNWIMLNQSSVNQINLVETLKWNLFQAVAFLPKILCDVKRVEIARAIRLCKSSVESFYFTVPRTKVGGANCIECEKNDSVQKEQEWEICSIVTRKITSTKKWYSMGSKSVLIKITDDTIETRSSFTLAKIWTTQSLDCTWLKSGLPWKLANPVQTTIVWKRIHVHSTLANLWILRVDQL